MSEEGIEQKSVKEAFDTNWVVPLGPNVDGFERDLEAWLSQHSRNEVHVVALASGTSAIHLALVMLLEQIYRAYQIAEGTAYHK